MSEHLVADVAPVLSPLRLQRFERATFRKLAGQKQPIAPEVRIGQQPLDVRLELAHLALLARGRVEGPAPIDRGRRRLGPRGTRAEQFGEAQQRLARAGPDRRAAGRADQKPLAQTGGDEPIDALELGRHGA